MLRQNPVRAGNLAVTVEYADGTGIQVLPAIRTKRGGIRIAHSGKPAWSHTIHPANFAEQLVAVNTAKSGRVVATIKLAKAIADCHIKRPTRKISGYHMECLTIQAFRNYDGELGSQVNAEPPVRAFHYCRPLANPGYHRAVQVRRRSPRTRGVLAHGDGPQHILGKWALRSDPAGPNRIWTISSAKEPRLGDKCSRAGTY